MRVLVLLLTIFCLNPALAQDEPKSNIGVTVYASACSNCHGPKVSVGIGAPTVHDVKAWKAIINKAKKASPDQDPYDYLIEQVKLGRGMMVHGGLCKESLQEQALCNDQAYKAAIKYMSKPYPKH